MKKAYKLTAVIIFVICNLLNAQSSQIQWQKSYGGPGWDEAKSIHQTTDGGYIVAGASWENGGDVSGNHGLDYWLVKLDPNGSIQWQKCYGGNGGEECASMDKTSDGGYVLVGKSNSEDGDVTNNHGGRDYWIVKVNSMGDIQWQKSLGGSGNDRAFCVRQTNDKGYIIAGESESNDGDVAGNHGGVDYWIVKLDSVGGVQWGKSLGGTDDDSPSSVIQTLDGGYIVCGLTWSNNGDVISNHGGTDYWVVKLNSTGNIQWKKSLGGSDLDNANSIIQTIDGGYLVVGAASSKDGDVTGNHSSFDYWIVKLNSIGNIQWQKSFGGNNADAATSVLQTSDAGFVIAGYAASSEGDVTGNHGGDDYWIVKLNTIGSMVWQKSLGGGGEDFAFSVKQTADKEFIIAGYSNSKNGDITNNHGNNDYWIVKLSGTTNSQLDLVEYENFIIYPNPAVNELYIESDYPLNGVQYKLIDMVGRQVLANNFTKEGRVIDMSSLLPGIYILQINEPGVVFKVIKKL